MSTKILHIGDMDSVSPNQLSYDFENNDFDAVAFSGDTTASLVDEGQFYKQGRQKMLQNFSFLDHVGESNGVPVFAIPGNHDGTGEWQFEPFEENIYRQTISQFDNITDLEYDIAEVNGQQIVGGGFFFSPEMFAYKDEVPNPALCEIDPSNYGESLEDVRNYTEDVLGDIDSQIETMADLGVGGVGSLEDAKQEIEAKNQEYERKKSQFEELLEQAENPILMHHGVPNFKPEESVIDKLQGPKTPSDLRGKNYGSVIGREVIEENELAAYLGGHIHEGQGQEELYGTPVFNGGSGGVYELEFDDGELLEAEFYEARS